MIIGESGHSEPKSHVVQRAAQILASLAAHGPAGARLTDLARDTGIARPSVHRILQDLTDVQYVRQLQNRRYGLGSALFSLGLNAPSPVRDIPAVRRIAQDLSDLCGDTVYVAIRQFTAVHYLARTEGSYPIRTHTVDVGDTLPLTSSYSGLVLMASLSDKDQEYLLTRLPADQSDKWQNRNTEEHEATLRRALAQFRDSGYVHGPDVVIPGVSGVAIAVPSTAHPSYMTLSISAVDARLQDERVRELLPALRNAASQISRFIE